MHRQGESGDTVGNNDPVGADATALVLGRAPRVLAVTRPFVPMSFAFFPRDLGIATFLDAQSLDNAVHTACVARTLGRSSLRHNPSLLVVRK